MSRSIDFKDIQAKDHRNVFLVDSRAWWPACASDFDPEKDLVLTFDFGLKKDIEEVGGCAVFVDLIIDREVMQENNPLVYDFFRSWHYDSENRDIFEHAGIPFGMHFRLDLWNSIIFYAKLCLCLEQVKRLNSRNFLVGSEAHALLQALDDLAVPHKKLEKPSQKPGSIYFFPIFRWHEEQVRPTRGLKAFKRQLRYWTTAVLGEVMCHWDHILKRNRGKKVIFIHEYHPTRRIIQSLKQDKNIRIVLPSFSLPVTARKLFEERVIPVWGRSSRHNKLAEKLILDLKLRRHAKLKLSTGLDISEGMYRVIESILVQRVKGSLHLLDCVLRYLKYTPIDLEILIANIGTVPAILDCVCRTRQIPSYLVINGFLSGDFHDESKHATYINSYSESIKNNYFSGMKNVFALGDPRMDIYEKNGRLHKINKERPVITIGTSGYNNTDLNSHLAVEFDFAWEIFQAIRSLKQRDYSFELVLKVRPNGYKDQYTQFLNEYFPDIPVMVLDQVPMKEVLNKADLYISIYSQTLFEASLLGIPVIYYKNDREYVDPPFDERSELVTVKSPHDLVQAILDFKDGHSRFDSFLDPKILEKYIGPLDGQCLSRNVEFIQRIIAKKS